MIRLVRLVGKIECDNEGESGIGVYGFFVFFCQTQVNKSCQATTGVAACCLLLSLAHLIRMGACQRAPPAIIMAPNPRATDRAGARFCGA